MIKRFINWIKENHLNELSKPLLKRYVKKAVASATLQAVHIDKRDEHHDTSHIQRKGNHRLAGIKSAKQRMKEEYGITSEYSNPKNPHHDLWKHGLPALRHHFAGHLIIGKRGEHHEDLAQKHGLDGGYDHGIYHRKEKKFYKHGRDTDIDSTDLMTSRQRMNREYGG